MLPKCRGKNATPSSAFSLNVPQYSPDDAAAPAPARAILTAIGYDNREERKSLAFLFHSREEAILACSRLLQSAFGLTDALPLEEDD
jgi:hypothetical protein